MPDDYAVALERAQQLGPEEALAAAEADREIKYADHRRLGEMVIEARLSVEQAEAAVGATRDGVATDTAALERFNVALQELSAAKTRLEALETQARPQCALALAQSEEALKQARWHAALFRAAREIERAMVPWDRYFLYLIAEAADAYDKCVRVRQQIAAEAATCGLGVGDLALSTLLKPSMPMNLRKLCESLQPGWPIDNALDQYPRALAHIVGVDWTLPQSPHPPKE